jgi:hypothetical protein
MDKVQKPGHPEILFGFFDDEIGGDMFPRNSGWLSNGLYGVISQKTEFFLDLINSFSRTCLLSAQCTV